MAYLRRGLVTNKGAVPSIHTREEVVAVETPVMAKAQKKSVQSPALFAIKKVSKILKMGETSAEYNFVLLECGHRAQSKSLYQGYCKECSGTM